MSDSSHSESSKKSREAHFYNRMLTVILALLIGVAIFITITVFHLDDLIDDLEKKTYDLRVSLPLGNNPEHTPSKDIIIIKFDDPTFSALEDEYGTWPWPRNIHAEMIDFLNQSGARAIAYDIMFVAKKKGLESSDRQLIDTFKKYDNVYLSMNFDNNKWIGDQLGKGLTEKDIEMVEPLALNLKSELSQENSAGLKLKNGFYENDAMTFNSFRRILPEFLTEKDRIAFINHGRDKDGVSRSNPLFFRFGTIESEHSKFPPFVQDTKTSQWHDSKGALVNAQGVLLNANGQPAKSKIVYRYFPYLGLKLAMDLKLPKEKNVPITLSEDGHLMLGKDKGYDIPLSETGSLLINWYNVNVEEQAIQSTLYEVQAYYNKLQADYEKASPQEQQKLKKEMKNIESFIHQFEINLDRTFEAQPYKEIPAWEIIRAMNNEKDGKLSDQDKALIKLLKDKIIFIGTTAVSTYDIKTTPINKLLPGVVLQATVFDNIYQNKFYMKRASTGTNMLLKIMLCLIAAASILRMRSAVSGLLTTAALAALYIAISVFVLKYMSLWINIAMPMVALAITTIITFMVKYMNRDQDYKKTYKLATTDGLTGLYNHRFFQEHLAKSIDYSDRFGTQFSLILIDIDFFKKFNDTYGHQAGDEVLRLVAKKLRNSVRSIDLVARYGGEEMAVILEKASEAEALDVARKLCRLVAEEEYPIAEGVSKHVTVSIGVATYSIHGRTPTELIEFADRGLYRAKETGRNRVGAQYDSEMEAEREAEKTGAEKTEPSSPSEKASA